MGSNPKIVYDLTSNGDFETAFENPFTTSSRGDDYSLSNVLSKGSARIYNTEPSFSKKIERKCSIFSVKSESFYPRTSPALASRNTRTTMENSYASFRIISPTSLRGNPNSIPEKSDSYFPVTSPSFAKPDIVLGNSNASFPKISPSYVGGNSSTIPEQSNSYIPITPRAYARGNPYSDSSFPILENLDASFPVTSPAFARRNPTSILGNSNASFSIASPAFVRGNPTSILEKSGSYFPTTPSEYARENPIFDASFPIISPPSAKGNHNTMLENSDVSFPITSPIFRRRNPTISPAFVRGNPISILEKSDSYCPLTSPSFARGCPNSMPVKSHAIHPTSGFDIGGTTDEYQQLEQKIMLRLCAPNKYNDSLPLSGQHGVGTSPKNQLEGVTRSTLQQNRSFTSYGLSSHAGKDWHAERADAYFQDTPPILKRKRGDDDENSVNKTPFLSSSQLLFDFQAGNDDHSMKKKPFLPSSQPAMYETAQNLFKDEKVSALQMTSARMLKLGTSIDTVTPGARTRECTRKDKGKSVLLNEESRKVNTYAKGKNIKAAVSTEFSIEEMKRLLEIDGNAWEDYPCGALAYENIVDTSRKLLENEERMSRKLQENEEEFHSWIFNDCPGLSHVPISEPQNLVHVAMDSSKNPNVSASNDDEFTLLPGEENPNLNPSDSIFNFHQHLNSMQKVDVNPNLSYNMMETGCERKEGENPGCGELLYTGNLGDLGFASEWMNDLPIKSDSGWMNDLVQPTNPFVNGEWNF